MYLFHFEVLNFFGPELESQGLFSVILRNIY